MLVTSNFSFSYNVFHSYISLVRQNAVLYGNGLITSMFVSQDIDSRPLQTSALQLLQRVVDSNDRVQDLAFGKLDILLSMQNKLPEVFQVIKLVSKT